MHSRAVVGYPPLNPVSLPSPQRTKRGPAPGPTALGREHHPEWRVSVGGRLHNRLVHPDLSDLESPLRIFKATDRPATLELLRLRMSVARDRRLSWTAIGLLGYLLTQPGGGGRRRPRPDHRRPAGRCPWPCLPIAGTSSRIRTAGGCAPAVTANSATHTAETVAGSGNRP
jgi:hypothetical protein